MPILRLFKVGRSVVVTLPPQVRETARLFCGDAVLVEAINGAIHIRAMEVRSVGPSPTIATDQDLRRLAQRGDE